METHSSRRPNKRSFKWLIPVAVVIVLAILLTPIRRTLRDGGSVEWHALLCKVTKLHRITDDTPGGDPACRVGTIAEILGMEVYNKTEIVEEDGK